MSLPFLPHRPSFYFRCSPLYFDFLHGQWLTRYRFLDHQMITNKKDALGTELISVPFRQDEMEAILEDVES